MNEAEFDKFADEYYTSHAAGIAISGEGPEYFSEYKLKDIALEFGWPSEPKIQTANVLDFGAGIGNSIPYVRKYFPSARLVCLDPSRRSLEVAERRFNDMARYAHYDGGDIPFPADHFDIAYAMCVFHHIDHGDHIRLLRELLRVVRPGGSLFIFEHNPYNPLTARVVNNCPFDENARLISGNDMKKRILRAGFSKTQVRYRVFFPRIFRIFRPLEAALAWLPLGGQYYVHARK